MNTNTLISLETEGSESNMKKLLSFQNKTDLFNFAKTLVTTDFCPKELKGKPEACYIACLYAINLGLDVFTGLHSIAIVNGRPFLWGDGILKLASTSSEWAGIESVEFTENDTVCTVSIKRKTLKSFIYAVSMADIRKEGKAGTDTWTKYPKDMLYRRAVRKGFKMALPEVFAGVSVTEADSVTELKDIAQDITTTPKRPSSIDTLIDGYRIVNESKPKPQINDVEAEQILRQDLTNQEL